MAYLGQLASPEDYSCEQRATKVHVRRYFVDRRCRSVDHSRACAMFNGWVAHTLSVLSVLPRFFWTQIAIPASQNVIGSPSMKSVSMPRFPSPSDYSCS